MAKTKIQKLRDKADLLMSQKVRERGQCERCGSRERLQHHHIVEKSRSSYLRYDFENALCLCSSCHSWWHHIGTLQAADWFKKKFGQERWDYLIAGTQKMVKTNIAFYEEAIERIGN